jgi:hypothetical protein
MNTRYARIVLILLAIAVYAVVVFTYLSTAKDGSSKVITLLTAAVGIGGATIAMLRSLKEK